MTAKRKEQIVALLKSIETGDEKSIAVINPNKYIQHNPQTHEGGEGLAALFKRLAKSSPRVNLARVFSDGVYVFAHAEYDFGNQRVGFEVFRFESDLTVEHWDNIQPRKGPNPSGHTMVDGEVNVTDKEKTEANRELVRKFVDDVLINAQYDKFKQYVDTKFYIEHNSNLTDDLSILFSALSSQTSAASFNVRYQKLHRLLAEGNFVLSVCEGFRGNEHTSFYDLYRLQNNMLVEHWDTSEMIPERAEWKNDNGKF